jgi:hypothetical protein
MSFLSVNSFNSLFSKGGKNASSVIINGTYSITTSGSYRFVTFTGNGSFRLANSVAADILIVGGGGTGGWGAFYLTGPHGGGGGGVGIGTLNFTKDTTYTVVVGNGGIASTTNNVSGQNGGDSRIYGGSINERAYGGGYGAANSDYTAGSAGGSSGGATSIRTPTKGNGGGSITYYGNQNGVGNSGTGGGGGGGAGSIGVTSTSRNGGNGGTGKTWSINSQIYGGGGGGGAYYGTGFTGGTGGSGGGGKGGDSSNIKGSPGTPNTGGGG